MSKRITILIFSIGIASVIILAVFGVYDYLKHRPQDSDIITKMDMGLGFKEIAEFQKQLKEAEDDLARDSKSFDAYTRLALAKENLGDWGEAVEVYLTMNELFPKNFLSYHNLGNLYGRMKAYYKAEKIYLKAIEVAPKNVSLYRNLTELYRFHLKEKMPEGARVLLKGLENNPNHVDLVGQLAVLYRAMGKKEKAIEYYEKLIKLDPTNETAKEELEELKRQGD